MKERPTSVTVFAIINLILCALGVLGTIFWLINKLGLMPQAQQKQPIAVAIEAQTGFTLYTDVATILGIFITILVISASIGMFSLKPWARKFTIGWALYSMLFLIVNYVISYILLYGPLLANMTGQELIITKFMMIGGAVVGVLFIGYHLLMLFMLTRPHVVDAFTPELFDDPDVGHTRAQPGGFNS